MALINCPECKKKVSEKAAVCPSCGYAIAANIQEVRQKKKEERSKTLKGWLILIMLIGVPYWFMSQEEETKVPSQGSTKSIQGNVKVKLTPEQILYNKVKKIPANQIAANRDGYQKLATLNPNSDLYKKKYNHYNNLVIEREQKRKASNESTINDNTREEQATQSVSHSSNISKYRAHASKLVEAGAISIDRSSYKIYFETAYWNTMSFREKEILCTILLEAYPGYSLLDKYSGKVLATVSMLGGVNIK